MVARVALWSRPNLLLGEVMDEEQLLCLVRLAVYNDQRHSSWGSPWACHAITCLLQDMIEGNLEKVEETKYYVVLLKDSLCSHIYKLEISLYFITCLNLFRCLMTKRDIMVQI